MKFGRDGQQNVMKDIPGLTSYATRRVVRGNSVNAFTLFIDKFIVDAIVECIQVQARSKSGNEDWSAYLVVIYARGLLAKGQPVD